MASRAIASPFVRDLSEIALDDRAHAGHKAANLGELIEAGFPVPPGFAVDSSAFVAFTEETGLHDRIATLLCALDVDDADELDRVTGEIQTAIETTPVPIDVRSAIVEKYGELAVCGEPATVAVRSSPTAGGELEAFGHLHSSFLCVRPIEAVLHAIRRCWSSLFGAQAILLRDKLGAADHDPDIAVVVQRQIDATRSGVIATTDGDDGPLTVEASYGLGESVVTGLVSPDVFTVEQSTLRILARDIHYKDTLVEQRPPDGGTRRRPVIGFQATCPALLDREVRVLAQLGKRIEEHYGAPQLVEWALDRDGHAWALQSDPVAAAPGAD